MSKADEWLQEFKEKSEQYKKELQSPLYTFPQSEYPVETQSKIVNEYVQRFQQTLDDEHDVGLLLTDFGKSVLMEVTEIGCEPPHLMIFRGLVNGTVATLIQNVSRLNFLITTVQKEPEKPHNVIGFTVPQEDKHSTSP